MVYRNLFQERVTGFIQSILPRTWEAIPETERSTRIRQFIAEAPLTSPFGWKVAAGFVKWLASSQKNFSCPFLLDLADSEYTRFEVSIDNDEVKLTPPFHLDVPWEEACLVLNPTLKLRCYRYPVHLQGAPLLCPPAGRAGKEGLGEVEYLAISRHPQTGETQCMELKPMAFAFLNLAQKYPERALGSILPELFQHHDGWTAEVFGQLLQEFLDKKWILGILKSNKG